MILSILAAIIGQVVLLYPQGQASDQGIVENGVQITAGPGDVNGLSGFEIVNPESGNVRNVSDSARMYLYIPRRCNGQMVIICPGGGYGNLAVQHEGHKVAKWMNKRGIAAAVLYYRLPNGHHSVPFTDVQNAFRYCRYHASEWGVSTIGVMGFSAGGHLAASASTLYVDECTRPDFSVLIYPVISSDERTKHSGTFANLTGNNPELMEYYSLEKRVTADTPPAFMALSGNDSVRPENSMQYFRRLRDFGVSAELYILPQGKHGWGFKDKDKDSLLPEYRALFYNAMETFFKTLNTKTK